MIAYSYLRFSTNEQSKGDSYRRQLEASENYAHKHGLILDKSLKLHDLGVSAFDKANVSKGHLGAFLKAVEQGKVSKGSYLLVESLDRLSRAHVMDAFNQFSAIISAGIIIVTLSDEQIYSEKSLSDSFQQLIISILIMARAHEESLMKSRRVGAAWQKKLDDAISQNKLATRTVPLWMRVIDGKVELIPERAKVVKRVFQMIKEGLSQDTITRTLNAEVPAWNKKNEWHTSYIHKLSQNHAVYGAFETGGRIAEGYFPAVISKEEFEYTRALRSKRRTTSATGIKRGRTCTNLFSGIAYCGYCGAKMMVSSNVSKKHNRQDHYLTCYGARIGKTQCACVRWNLKEIEGSFLFQVPTLDINTVLGFSKSDKAERLEEQLISTSAALDAEERKVTNLYVAIEQAVLPGLVERLKGALVAKDELAAEKQRLMNELTVERVMESSGQSRMRNLILLFKALKECKTDLELRTIREALYEQIRTFVEKIVLYPTGPSLNLENRDMRFMKIHFKSGKVVEII